MALSPLCVGLSELRVGLSLWGVQRVWVLGAFGLLPLTAPAQPAVPSGLAPGAVVAVDGFVFARARAPLRDPLAPLQTILASRASFYAARWLCQYTPTPDTRLDATLTGVGVVDSRSEGDQLTVTVRLPMQRPDCVVRSVPPSVPETSADLPSGYPTPSPYSGQSARPSEIN